ncbi:MAG TPA: PqqD family protein [Pyrinomonadaceae bacterium]|jgi:hypothetical protein|nr:PqqD family protein [Pyrinomonadaceae bacterium]
MTLPRARRDSLVIKELQDETLVYDLKTHKAHCLNETAAFVWQRCDGRATVPDITRSLESRLGVGIDESLVWLALDELEKYRLLDNSPRPPAEMNVARRQVIRMLGLAAVTLPVITSIVAPVAAQQASGLPPGSCCNGASECASGHCVQSPTCIGVAGPSTKSCQ